jgi:hypothetical protein
MQTDNEMQGSTNILGSNLPYLISGCAAGGISMLNP